MQSAVSPSFVSVGVVFISLFTTTESFAQTVESEPDAAESLPVAPIVSEGEPSQPEVEEQEPVVQQVAASVRIVSVGSSLSPHTLQRMLGSALQPSFELRFSKTRGFQPEQLFQSRSDSPEQVHVWVDTSVPRRTRIYFANRAGTRYLVRDLELSDPPNEMDREAVAQAIEWSLQALAEGSVGLTREEAEELLAEPSVEPASPVEAKAETPPPAPVWRTKTEGWLPEVALLHRYSPAFSELLMTQGPELRITADRLRGLSQMGLGASLNYQYPQRHVAEGIALSVETVAARIEGRYLATGLIRGSGVGARLGFGLDAIFASPEALDWQRFEAAENQRTLVPVLSGGLVWQIRVESSVRFEVDLGLAVDLAEVRYDIMTEEGPETLLSRWPVRPEVGVGVALF